MGYNWADLYENCPAGEKGAGFSEAGVLNCNHHQHDNAIREGLP